MHWDNMYGGTMEVELTSAQIESSLEQMAGCGIILIGLVHKSELMCRFRIKRSDYPAVRALCQERGENLAVVGKRGIYWELLNFLNRPVLVLGFGILLVLIALLPMKVLFVRVEGNREIPERQILEAAEMCGIQFGASRRAVRSEKMKNSLLAALPQLQWAGINTSGCTAVISVREGERTAEERQEPAVSSIVADRDGYILSGTVTRGNGLFCTGQTVKAGQVLISGYTDCGICIRGDRAEGEIKALTSRNLCAVMLPDYKEKMQTRKVMHAYSLVIRKKRINLWKDSGISDGSCGRMYKEHYITLPGGFRLPIALCVEKYVEYDTQIRTISSQDAATRLALFAKQYLAQQMVAGEVAEKKETVHFLDASYRLYGQYTCVEMIGREVIEQIGETNGKAD